MSDSALTLIFSAVAAAVVFLASVIGVMFKMLIAVRDNEAKCQTRVAVLELEMAHAKSGIGSLQAAVPKVAASCWVKVSLHDGLIVGATDEITPILGWKPAELIGKHVNTVIPAELMPEYEAGVKQVIATGSARVGVFGLRLFATHSFGVRVPVLVDLSEVSRDPAVVALQVAYRNL